MNAPSDAACGDGLFCNGVETCNATSGCQAGTPVDCNDGDVCTDDTCNEGADRCDHVFDPTNDPSCQTTACGNGRVEPGEQCDVRKYDGRRLLFADLHLRAAGIGLQRRALLQHNAVRGKCAFEIGTWNGLTAAMLSQYFDEVITVDIAHNKQKHAILKHLGITNVRCVDITENAEKAMALRGVKIDFAYLDGNHAEDTESDFDLVRRCGRVLFHECWPFQLPVWSLVHSLPVHQVVYGGVGLALWDKFRPGPEPLEPRNG